jgi:hypothetical protein
MTTNATTYDIRFIRGDSFTFSVDWSDSNNDPVTIASARLHIRRQIEATTTLLELTDGSGIVIAGGNLTISMTPAQTATSLSGYYDLEATSDGGEVKTLISGKVIVTPDVTR